MGTHAYSVAGRCLMEEAAARMRLAPAQTWRAESDAAAIVARYLACHPRLAWVRYPGLPADPMFKQASTSLISGFGPFMAFELEDGSLHWLRVGEADAFALIETIEATIAESS